jgi:hypothetical protein
MAEQNALGKSLEDDYQNLYRISNLTEVFYRFPDIGTVPELQQVFEKFRYSYGRGLAAKAMSITGPADFSDRFAIECLWDCELSNRLTGLKAVDVNREGVSTRLRAMASGGWEEEEVKRAAENRISKSV